MQFESDPGDLEPRPDRHRPLERPQARIAYIRHPPAPTTDEIEVDRRPAVVAAYRSADLLDQSEISEQVKGRIHRRRTQPGKPLSDFLVDGFDTWMAGAAHDRVIDRHPLRGEPSAARGEPLPQVLPPARIYLNGILIDTHFRQYYTCSGRFRQPVSVSTRGEVGITSYVRRPSVPPIVHPVAGFANPPTEPASAARSARAGATWERSALLGVLVLAAGLRWELLGTRPLWLDEAYSVGVAGKTLYEILAFLRTSDAHPIGYYALLALWIRWFGVGLVEMRALSLICGVAAVFLTWRLSRQLFSPAIGIVAAAVVALNPFQIIVSNEIRMYPLLACLVLASTWTLWRASQSPGRLWWWGAYGASVALLGYTSYYSFFLVPAQILWVLLRGSLRPAIVNLCVAGGVALALYLPWIPYALTLPDRPVPWRQPLHLDYVLSVVATQIFGGYLFKSGSYYMVGTGLAPAYDVLLLLPFLALLVAGAFTLGRLNTPAQRLVGLSWVVPLVLIVLVSLARGGLAAFPRHLVFLEPFAAIGVAAGIVRLGQSLATGRTAVAPKVLVPVLGSLLVIAFTYPAIAQADPAHQLYRYDLAADFVRSRYKSGDVIIYFPAGTDLPFRYYFRPPGEQIVILADRRRWTRPALHHSIKKAADYLAAHEVERVWLVFSLPWPKGSLSDLVQALNARKFHESPMQDFRDLWVMLLIRTSSPHGDSRSSLTQGPDLSYRAVPRDGDSSGENRAPRP